MTNSRGVVCRRLRNSPLQDFQKALLTFFELCSKMKGYNADVINITILGDLAMEKVRFGIIGAGNMGSGHLRNLLANRIGFTSSACQRSESGSF